MNTKLFLFVLAMFAFASPILAADGSGTTTNFMTPGFGMAIASGLCGLAQGRAIAGSAEAMARNPSATNAIRGALILGLILIESLALYTLVIIFLKG